jgi:aspartate racemase
VRLFAKIKKTYQVDLELAVLFESRTVSQLAEVIRKAQQPASGEQRTWSSLVPIQPHGSQIPIFCVHAVRGGVVFYEQLSKALGPDQPFYAFQSPLLFNADTRETSIEELASIYVKELRAFSPEGPYVLGGLSFGGLVAFEMAQQLYAQGVEPALLLLFDPAVPGNEKHVEVKERVSSIWGNLLRKGAPYVAQRIAIKIGDLGQRLLWHARNAGCACYRLVGRRLPLPLRFFEVEETHTQAMMRYTFHTYPGKITLLRALESLDRFEDPTLGWGQFAGGGLETHDVDSGHMSMFFEPYVSNLAEKVKPLLPQRETIAPHRRSAA